MAADLFQQATRRKILKVHELTAQIRQSFEERFSDLWIEGEVADLKMPQSGHLYFNLKDNTATIKGVVFRSHMRFLRFRPKVGDSVLIRGRIDLYEARGEFQLICDYIEPRGAGALQAAFEALKNQLQREGLFDEGRKRPMPIFPARVGLITSPSGAAIQDILKVLREREFRCEILLHPIPVQGWGAAEKIAKAIVAMNRLSTQSEHPIDLLILSRGGGSMEDLWAFNEEVLARAIAHSEIPIISAVGHESDTTIADYVADLRAPTPSVAAEMLARQGTALFETLHTAHERLIQFMRAEMETARQHLSTLTRLLSSPGRQAGFYRDRVDRLAARLHRAMHGQIEQRYAAIDRSREGLSHLSPLVQLNALRRRLTQQQERLIVEGRRSVAQWHTHVQKRMAQLNLLSPLNILGRGYSITQKLPSRSLVRSSTEVEAGDRLEILLHRGTLICSVEKKGGGRGSLHKSGEGEKNGTA